MRDEASSSAAAAAANSHPSNGPRIEEAVPPSAAEHTERRKKNRQNFNKKRGELLDDLLRSLDILFYAELSAVYYMDCSFIRFLIRGFVQFVFLTPKPSIFPDTPAHRPYVGAIMGSNLLCFILHVMLAAPVAGEATRGYLHGGLAMDFIGQRGPTSKLHLLLLDILLISIQLVHMTAHVTRQKLKETSPPTSTTTAQASAPAPVTTQDLDHEERGVRRSEEQENIEMQTLDPQGAVAGARDLDAVDLEATSERDSLLAATAAPPTDAHIFDAFNSGQIVLADLDVLKTIKEQFWAYKDLPREQLDSGRILRANITGQLSRLRSLA